MATETLPLAPGKQARQPRPPRPARQPRPPRQPRQPRPVSSPRHTRPFGEPRRAGTATRGTPRAPFIVLVVGLLGGALISLLVISTTLDEGSYRINQLTEQNNELYKQKQYLVDQVAVARNPGTIAREAAALGMKPDKALRFIDTASGKISVSAP